MRQSRLGDLSVSRVGLGCNNFGRRLDRQQSRAVIDAAIDVGINFLDTADIYGQGASESFIGEALAGRRNSVVIATKFGWDRGDGETARGSRAYVRDSVEGSLARLGTDCIDLLYYHAPDGVTPLAETLDVLDALVREGKVRAIGCSHFSGKLLDEAEAIARASGKTRFTALQNEYNLLSRGAEGELLQCRDLGIGFVPYFPLANGLLTGKYRRNTAPPAGTRLEQQRETLTSAAFSAIEQLEAFARARGRTLLELAIAGIASQEPVVSVIAGASTPEQVRANAAAGEWELSLEDLELLPQFPPRRT